MKHNPTKIAHYFERKTDFDDINFISKAAFYNAIIFKETNLRS